MISKQVFFLDDDAEDETEEEEEENALMESSFLSLLAGGIPSSVSSNVYKTRTNKQN